MQKKKKKKKKKKDLLSLLEYLLKVLDIVVIYSTDIRHNFVPLFSYPSLYYNNNNFFEGFNWF